MTNDYVPLLPDDDHDFMRHHCYQKCSRIMVETDSYFENAKIINFDLIHNECRGDDLEFDRKYSQTLFKKKVERNILENHRYDFVSAAKRSESSDVNLEKDQVLLCFSSMEKRKKKCTTEDCKSLPFLNYECREIF